MFDWLRKKNPEDSPRTMLGEAVADATSVELADRALRLFDSSDELQCFFDEARVDTPWEVDGRKPGSDELAATIFLELLLFEEYIGIIDWSEGTDSIVETCDNLLVKAGTQRLSEEERLSIAFKATDCKRGEHFLRVRTELETAAESRGLVFFCIDRGEDAHLPMLLKPVAYDRWRNARFGKGFPVLP